MAEEQSHREEMNAAIRAQRERLRKVAPTTPSAKPLLVRLVSRLRGK
ncbi:MAG TPA: hypothetical protein VIE38_07390 [Gaiellaceae bacterium]|jgi:hypothetical protein